MSAIEAAKVLLSSKEEERIGKRTRKRRASPVDRVGTVPEFVTETSVSMTTTATTVPLVPRKEGGGGGFDIKRAKSESKRRLRAEKVFALLHDGDLTAFDTARMQVTSKKRRQNTKK